MKTIWVNGIFLLSLGATGIFACSGDDNESDAGTNTNSDANDYADSDGNTN